MVVTYWSYNDALVQAYTLPYLHIINKILPSGSKIYLVTLEKNPGNYPEQMDTGNNIINIRLNYVPFSGKAALQWIKKIWFLRKFIRKNEIDTIHAWCTPAGMIAYILAKSTKKTLIIDSYEPHAEAMVENGDWKKDSRAYRLLFKYERKMSHYASHLIAATHGMENYAREKYGISKSIPFVKPACVDLNQFNLSLRKDPSLLKELQFEGKIIGVYAGKFGGIYLREEFFEWLKTAIDHWGDKFRLLLLTAHSDSEIKEMADPFDIDQRFIVRKFVPHTEVPRYLGLADFAITPVKPVPTKRFCTPIKDGEYWAMGLPVIITKNISDDSQIIDENNAGFVLNELNQTNYKSSVAHIDQLIQQTKSNDLVSRIRPLAEKYRNYTIAEAIYKTIYQ